MTSEQELQRHPTHVATEDFNEDNQVTVDSVTLDRLIHEVSLEKPQIERSYNRTYNRHNR